MDAQQRAMLESPRVQEGLSELSRELNLSAAEVQKRAQKALQGMWSTRTPLVDGAMNQFSNFVTQNYALQVSTEALEHLRELDRNHALMFLFSHRSYMDTLLLNSATQESQISPLYNLAGANLNFWPFGAFIRRAGGLFIRRGGKKAPVYRFMLRAYID